MQTLNRTAIALLAITSMACLVVPASADVLFQTEILSMNLSGGPFPMPLAQDPGNLLGDSINGYGFVDTQVTITGSSQRTINPGPQSLGQACAQGCPPNPPIDPSALHGPPFFVSSFFDVHFDLELTDVDARPGRDFVGQPDGATLIFQDVAMLNTQTFANHTFDQNEESFDLLMPLESDLYIGFPADIPLGTDVNGNSVNDKLSFTLATYNAQNSNRLDTTLITNLLWHHEYDAAARFEGQVEAVTGGGGTPFAIGALLPNGQPDPNAFGGRDLVESRLVNPLIPEPSTGLLMTLAACVLSIRRPNRKNS